MQNIKSFFELIAGTLAFMSLAMLLISGKFEKKLLAMLTVGFIFARLVCVDFDFSAIYNEYKSIICDAEKSADDIRLNIENSMNNGENSDE